MGNQRHKQDMDAVYEELDQKVYEKNFLGLEDNVCKLTRGAVKLCQVVGVFPGARMDDGTEEELDIDVELLTGRTAASTWSRVSTRCGSSTAGRSINRFLTSSARRLTTPCSGCCRSPSSTSSPSLSACAMSELWNEVVD